jgi:hypothetical protein
MNVLSWKRAIYIFVSAVVICIAAGVMALWLQMPAVRADGWYLLSTAAVSDVDQIAIIANRDVESPRRAVAWEWQRHGKEVDSGFLGVIAVEYPASQLSPQAVRLTDHLWIVYDARSSTLWGAFRVGDNVQLLGRAEADSEGILTKARAMLGLEQLQWMVR